MSLVKSIGEVEKVILTTLKKGTICGVEYRKATILLSNALDKVCHSSDFSRLFTTAVQISEALYSSETDRSQRAILRFHNVAFQHAVLCIHMFHTPKGISKKKCLGDIFTHCQHMRQSFIGRRSLNTKHQERLFNYKNNV